MSRPGLAYTFALHDAAMSVATHHLSMPMLPFGTARVLRGRVVQTVWRGAAAGEAALAFKYWNRRLRKHLGG